jgi:polyhydroxybutyrate depolymerase
VLYVPSGYTPGNSSPLVVNLHGDGGTAARQNRYSGMDAVAEQNGFLVVYPEAIGVYWLGNTDRTDPYDDCGFVDDVVSQVCSNYSVNISRVYTTGFSAGSVMSFILIVKSPYTYAAAACVSGPRPYALGTTTRPYAPTNTPATPSRPFPLLQVHGTGDKRIPYSGGLSYGWTWPPCEQVVTDFVTNNHCSLTPTVTNLPNINPTDDCTVQLLTYTNGDTYLDREGNPRQAEVLFYRVVGGGHSWPADFVTDYYPWNLPVNHDINASTEIWNFFSRHAVAAIPSGRFEGFTFSPGTGFSFTFRDAGMGARYRIQASPSLAGGSWANLTNFTYAGPIMITDPDSTGTTRRFYRGVSP